MRFWRLIAATAIEAAVLAFIFLRAQFGQGREMPGPERGRGRRIFSVFALRLLLRLDGALDIGALLVGDRLAALAALENLVGFSKSIGGSWPGVGSGVNNRAKVNDRQRNLDFMGIR